MTTSEQNILEKITLYLTGEADQKVGEEIKQWVSEDEGNKAVFDEIQDIWFALNATREKKQFEIEKAWEKYSAWIDDQNNISQKKGAYRYLNNALKYAAVVAIAVLSTYYLTNFGADQEASADIIAHIPIGQTGNITLADGTQVQLNGGSTLICSSFNKQDERRVALTGEGYFKVAHNPDKPFIVDVNNMDVKVYGTEFNIQGYKDDLYTQTALVKGKVGVQLKSGAEYLLKPNELINVFRNGQVEILKNQALDDHISWLNDKYRFKNETLGQIVKKLERMYGYSFFLSDQSMANEVYTGQFTRHESIENVMIKLAMTSTFKLGYKIKDKEITLYKK